MDYLNYEFLEEFKKLDKICREIYGESPDNKLGVTMYIDDMERSFYSGKRQVFSWDEDLKTLKRVRNMRNEIVHSTHQSYECTQADIEFVRNFYQRILNQKDPLSFIKPQRNRYDSFSHSRYNSSKPYTYHRQYQTQPVGCATFMFLTCLTVIILALII